MGQAEYVKHHSDNDSSTVGFKHLRYEVAESNKFVTVTIEKKIKKDFNF